MKRLDLLFEPRSVAIIGASERNFYARNCWLRLTGYGYPGPIHLVNPNAAEAFGRKTVPDAGSIGEPIDFAFVSVPRRFVPDTLRACHAAGAKAAVVVSNGFGESGDDEGRRLQDEMAAILVETGMAVCGPSCLGVINVGKRFHGFGGHPGVDLLPGRIALVSQSGANVHSYIGGALARNIGFSYIVSSGNEAGLEAAEYAEYFLDDPNTSVVCLFVESFKSPERLIRVAEKAQARDRPIIAIKIGRSESAARAALAHTGSMTGSDQFYDTLFRQWGIIRADTIEDALDKATIFAASEPRWWPAASRIGLVSISGGFASTFSDLSEAHGLSVPDLAGPSTAELATILPSNVRPQNPVDISTQVRRDRPTALAETIDTMTGDPHVDVLLNAEAVPQTATHLATLVECRERHGKPVILGTTSPSIPILTPELLDQCRRDGIPVLAGVEGSLRAIGAAVAFRRAAASRRERPAAPAPIAAPTGAVLHEVDARALLAPLGIKGPAERLASTPAEAQQAADALGDVVVVKIVSSHITHRSDAGLVRIRVPAAQVGTVAAELAARVEADFPGTPYDILVQRMVSGVAELFIGVTCAAGFAPMIVVGVGGVFVELLGDRATRIAPVDAPEAEAMLRELRLFPLLDGYRGARRADLAAAGEAIVALSRFAAASAAWLAEAEINPLIVLEQGQGAVAVDALIVARGATVDH